MAVPNINLPYAYDQLVPFLSKKSVKTHHQRHQEVYVKALNNLISGTEFASMNLNEIISKSEGKIFYYAAEIWNHHFFWSCLRPLALRPSPQPSEPLLDAFEQQFDSYNGFKQRFESKSLSNFGTGWTWLVQEASGCLKIVNTNDALTPLLDVNSIPLLAIDLWEHSYYLDYLGDKENYISNFWKVLNWEFVNRVFTDRIHMKLKLEQNSQYIYERK